MLLAITGSIPDEAGRLDDGAGAPRGLLIHIYIYIYIYSVCVCVYVYIYICTCMYIYIYHVTSEVWFVI